MIGHSVFCTFTGRSSRALIGMTALLAALFTAPKLDAQVLYGSIVGTVTDQAAASIPNAKVRITSNGTTQTRETETDAAGTYAFPSLPPDTYEVVISKQGFQTLTFHGTNVAADNTVRVDAVLKIGAVDTSVEVAAEASSLQTENGEVRSAITTTTLENVPTPIGRNYQNLLIIVPGVMPPANQHSVAANPSRGLTFNVNGTTRNSNNVRIDGALANNIWLPHVTAYVPGLDAIESVSMVTASADASEGMAGGSAINVQIKSGTNQIHGSLFEYHADSVMKAKPFFLPVGQGIPKYIDNQFGGSIGGPILKNRLFYFGSWEDSLNRQTGASFVTVPTGAMHTGDLSGSTTAIYDPLSGNPDGTGRTPFGGNLIPSNRIDPIAAKVIAAYPLPTFPSLLANNYYATGAYAYSRSKLDGKGTWVATPKLNINGRMGWLKYTMSDPPVFGQNGGGPVASAGGRAGTAHGDVYSMTYSGSYIVRPNLVVDSYFGYTKSVSDHDPVGLDQQIGLKVLGLPGTNVTPLAGGWPDFQVSSYSDVGTPGGSSTLRYRDSQFEYTANASWVKSKHTVRFGVDVSQYSLNHYEATSAMGVFVFSGGQTTLKGGPSANQYNSVAQLLLGLTSSVTSELLPFDNNQMTSRQKSYSFYGQDMWQVSRKLTASVGLRWDYFPMGTRASRGMERYDFNTNQMLICGMGGVSTDCGYNIEQKNVSPRIGLAYRPTETTVIRAGFGINYDPYPLAFVRDMLTNYPEDLLLTVNPTVATYGPATQLKDGIPAIQVPDLSSGRVSVPVQYATRSLPDKVVRGYIESWNFSLQKQIQGGWMAQAAYVGSRQLKINERLDLNAGQVPGAGTAGQPYFVKFGRTTATELLTPVGHNKYDSLQTSLQRRMSRGVSMNFNYTFSKALGICCDDLADGYPSIQIPEYMRLNRAVMPYDRTHTFGAAFLMEAPFGRGKKWLSSGIGSKLAGGWRFNGLIAAYSGQPFTVTSNTPLNAPNNSQRASLAKSSIQILGGTGPNQSFFDPFAFTPSATGTIGTAALDAVRGPGTFNFDGGLFREFRLTERWKAEFRAEALNLTNTPHFANPGANVSNMVLDANGAIKSLGGYTVITSTTGTGREGIDERLFRLGLRITF
jgi:outer membrane receptor protein involved in Fe transport